MVKVSLICTIKNEEETIESFLESICNQSKVPDEIIIVDGGSSDSTVEIINSYRGKLPINLIISPNANIAEGRNIAIRKAKHEIICVTDGGCYLDKSWVSNLIKPLEKNSELDVISGVYLPWSNNEFEKTAADLFFPNIKTLDEKTFLPSARSILFKKTAWSLVGGFPEQLPTAEDTLFDLNLKKRNLKFGIAKDAIVYWSVRKNISSIFKQFYRYAKSEGLLCLFPRRFLPRYISIFLISLIWLVYWNRPEFYILITLSGFAGFWIKYLKKIKKKSFISVFRGLLIASTIETGLIIGYSIGLLEFITRKVSRYT